MLQLSVKDAFLLTCHNMLELCHGITGSSNTFESAAAFQRSLSSKNLPATYFLRAVLQHCIDVLEGKVKP
jgi:hypothetical protein